VWQPFDFPGIPTILAVDLFAKLLEYQTQSHLVWLKQNNALSRLHLQK